MENKIDREALVKRHIPSLNAPDSLCPFTVGNGTFAFTTDFTGLQTFPEFYENKIPLCTQSQWGWHSVPNKNHYTLDQAFKAYNTYGRKVNYASRQNSEAGQWLRANPHRLHLGQIGFKLRKTDGSEATLQDIKNIHQVEDIWEGIIKSSFSIDGKQMRVETACHPQQDQVAVKIKSEILKLGNISIAFDFPYGSTDWGKTAADWNNPDKHSTEIITSTTNSVMLHRILDSTQYFVKINWAGNADFKKVEKHSFVLHITAGDEFQFSCLFTPQKDGVKNDNAEQTFDASKRFWKNFWETGGAIDLSESKDSRADELERRIILSRYVTRIQCAGDFPPQETGLTFNSWYGKFHLEMHWWHGVHFALWGKPELLEKSVLWYKKIMPQARKTAQMQGYEGVRWPKMVSYDSREGPSGVGVFLIWQQPHPIYYAETLYRCYKDPAVLENYKDIVFETARFMASYAHWDDADKRYVLGPPLIPAQEIYKADSTINPAFELSYWRYGLKTAQEWRKRLGLEPDKKWADIIDHLSALPQNNGLYQNTENALNTFTNDFDRNDHPTLLGAFGMLPNETVDKKMMEKTLQQVLKSWNWKRTWGWDYPMIAMTAARVGRPDLAVDALLMDVQKNTYLPNGHNYQDNRLTIYLPGNGGLLTAIAMMAAGWDGAPDVHAPGFPRNGQWVVKYEGLSPMQ